VTPGTCRAGSAVWCRRHFLALAALAGLIRPARAESAIVEIRKFAFVPAELEIAAGRTVAFINLDLVPHTATGDAFDTGTLKKGERAEIAFPAAGTFAYVCKLHPHMKGRILVR
jgi:plastocyanin